MKYIKFACDEELERLHEYLYGLENNYDQSGDKYYVEYPMSCCPPDKEDVEKALQGRDFAADFSLIDTPHDVECKAMSTAIAFNRLTKREELYQTIRELIL